MHIIAITNWFESRIICDIISQFWSLITQKLLCNFDIFMVQFLVLINLRVIQSINDLFRIILLKLLILKL